MGKKVEIKLNSAGVQAMLHDVGSKTCLELARNAAERCGDGYIAQARTYPERTAAVVTTATAKAYSDNLANNTILKAVMGG